MDHYSKALLFADVAHRAVGQKRKYTGEPYINHCIEVAELVMTVPHTMAMLQAALLHDTVEDTQITVDDLTRHFGFEVANLVYHLTHKSKKEDGNRAMRKAIDRDFLARSPAEVQTIKYADLISNLKDIAAHDKDFAKVYLAEKQDLLRVMNRGDRELFGKAFRMAWSYQEQE